MENIPQTLVITIPADDTALYAEIQQQLTPYARVEILPPTTLDFEHLKLAIEIVGGAISIAANAASIMNFILTLKQQRQQTSKPSGIRVGLHGERGMPIEDVDEVLLRELLEIR